MQQDVEGYPRPQMVRNGWTCLDGTWDFAFDDAGEGDAAGWASVFPAEHTTIRVPFSYETRASGIADEIFHPCVWYHRELPVAPPVQGCRVLLHFEGSDFRTSVYVNGRLLGTHDGGYVRFSFDITDALVDGTNGLTVKVEDSYSLEQPRGKQRWKDKSFNCWYVPTTGIWKTVWLEEVPECHVSAVRLVPSLAARSIRVGCDLVGVQADASVTAEIEVAFDGDAVAQEVVPCSSGHVDVSLAIPSIHPWSCEDPALYDVTVRLRASGDVIDEVRSYFGLRDISIADGQVLLNGKPLYQRLVLDQGYWPDSGLTAPDEDAFARDLDAVRELGFNGLRMHMKIEDERFLRLCDERGVLVWGEMPAAYEFSDHEAAEFTREWTAAVAQTCSHPCIICWVPFNESWGVPDVRCDEAQQGLATSVCRRTKELDPTRPVISNDGWEHTTSDIITIHDYEGSAAALARRYRNKDEVVSRPASTLPRRHKVHATMADGYSYQGQPVILSECGGIAFTGGEKGSWGYGHAAKGEDEFIDRYGRLVSAIKGLPYVVGYCYTQLTDVQQEVNGLLSADRHFKVDPARIREANLGE